MSDLLSFGRLLRQYRRARDLTREEPARRTACALTTKKIDADERRPGGVGKTCVARELARGRDMCWADIAPLVEATLIPQVIGAALWPDASPRQVKSNFRVAIYHLRRALGETEWIVFSDGHYAFNRARDYWLDSEEFTRALVRYRQHWHSRLSA
jgi:hypothetical protein